MKGTVLVTDSLFIFKEHEEQIRAAGYEIERLDKPKATEGELVEAVKGKVGYILGGIEQVTPRIVESSPSLRAIAICATDWTKFIADPKHATEHGVGISFVDTYSTDAVAEYTTLLMLAMLRNVFDIGSTGTTQFFTGDSIFEKKIGLIGLGRIGRRTAQMLIGMGVKDMQYFSRTRNESFEHATGITYVPLESLLATSDIVSLHLPSDVGEGYFDANKLAQMKDGAVLINTAFEKALDFSAAYTEVSNKRLRVAHDGPVGTEFKNISPRYWFNSNQHSGFNTHRALKLASASATNSLLNLLETGKDQYRVN